MFVSALGPVVDSSSRRYRMLSGALIARIFHPPTDTALAVPHPREDDYP